MAIDAKVLRELYDELKPFLWHVISDTVALRAVGTLPGLEGNEIVRYGFRCWSITDTRRRWRRPTSSRSSRKFDTPRLRTTR